MSKSLKALLGSFTPSELPQDQNSLIPEGQYTGIIDKIEVKTSKTGNSYLSVWHKLQGNAYYNNSMVFDNLNLGHSDPKVQRQALGTLTSLLKSAGIVLGKTDSLDELVAALPGCITTMYVTRRDGQNGYGPSNNVSRYVTPNPYDAAA
tara:strand:- start:4 stop:450 length:447 start_codon:yes stop_codon:yes gene_type:complete